MSDGVAELGSFQLGETVTIHMLDRFPRVEGQAELISRAPHPHTFYVRFMNEKLLKMRVVLPRRYQERPDTVTNAQLARWRAISRSLLVAEFYPGWR
jgi:hypothetical protein